MPVAPVKVSVLVTLYNKDAFVEECVESILANTFTDFELLVVDDASTDGSLERVKRMADPRLRILESPVNTGRAAAANRGYDAAVGEYVAVLDADDLMAPERLAKQVEFMDAHPEVGACGSWSVLVGDATKVIRTPPDDAGCRAVMLFGMPALYPSVMLRRSVLEAHGLRCDPEWQVPGMDYLFMLRIGRHAAYANLQEPLLTYRLGANNMRHGRDERSDRLLLEREVFRFFGLPASDAELRLHMAFHGLPPAPFNAAHVRALRAWQKKLSRMNRDQNLFPTALFEAELERRWALLFHRLADQDLGGALAHLQRSGRWPTDRLAYLAKTTLNRWTGRKR